MSEKLGKKEMNSSLLPVEDEVKNLLDMFEFFLAERHLDKSIGALGDSVRDMRLIIGRLLSDHFMKLPPEGEAKFCSSLASMLADRAETLPFDSDGDREYVDYCIGEILTSFEYAQEVKEECPEDPVLQKILALDIPILRPFNYGMRDRLSLVKAKKKRKVYQS
ncbi:MAG: hypothetical protein V2A66_11320 [Pseudomonadota bacterium]